MKISILFSTAVFASFLFLACDKEETRSPQANTQGRIQRVANWLADPATVQAQETTDTDLRPAGHK